MSRKRVRDESVVPRSVLRRYYAQAFPHEAWWRWYCERPAGSTKEVAFFFASGAVLRPLAYATQPEFSRALCTNVPVRFEVGASSDGGWVARDLVLDIDINDYDAVRECCTGSTLCDDCWPLVTRAAAELDRVLEEELGFARRLWVFSGRRGVHCWLPGQRDFSAEERQMVADYLAPHANLDAHVTTDPGHLLKAPFCVHPKTGFVCTPFDVTAPPMPGDFLHVARVLEDPALLAPAVDILDSFTCRRQRGQ